MGNDLWVWTVPYSGYHIHGYAVFSTLAEGDWEYWTGSAVAIAETGFYITTTYTTTTEGPTTTVTGPTTTPPTTPTTPTTPSTGIMECTKMVLVYNIRNIWYMYYIKYFSYSGALTLR